MVRRRVNNLGLARLAVRLLRHNLLLDLLSPLRLSAESTLVSRPLLFSFILCFLPLLVLRRRLFPHYRRALVLPSVPVELPAARRGVLLVDNDNIMVKLPSVVRTEREHTKDGQPISRHTSLSPTPRVARGKERNRGCHSLPARRHSTRQC